MAAALITTMGAAAQSEDTTEVGRAVVSTGNIQPVPASRSVHHVRIITAATIERQGSYNLRELLIKENNIRIGNDNILGSSLSLQGISGQNIKILLDGIPMIGRENGNIDLAQINLINIERVEIIEGPLSVIYGTDALGGVINLVSKRIMLDSTRPYLVHANSYYETIGQYNLGAGGVFRLRDIDFGATINRNFFDGFSTDKDSRVMFWKPKQQVFGNFSITKQTGKLKTRFRTEIFTEKIENRGFPIINHLEAYAYDDYYLTNRSITSLDLERKISKNSYWHILSSFSYYQRDKVMYRKDLTLANNNLEPVPSPEANSSTSFLNLMSRGTYSSAFRKIMTYQLGYDVNLNSAFGTKIEADRGRMNDYAMFACAEFKPLRALSVKPGFRATYNTRYAAPFIPSIQFMYTGIRNLTIRYAYGRGFRAPGLKELYLYFVDYNHNIIGSPDLKSEMSDNHNAAIRYRLKVHRKLILYIDNSWYHNQIYNQIALVATNPANIEYTYRNIDNFKSIGTVLNVSGTYRNLRMTVGGSYMGIYNNAFEMVGKQRYTYSPEFRMQSTYLVPSGRLRHTAFSVFYKYNGSTFGYALDQLRNVVNTASDDFHILDATVSKPVWKNKLKLTVGCKNIMNVTTIRSNNVSSSYHSSGSNTMPVSVGRSFFIQANFKI